MQAWKKDGGVAWLPKCNREQAPQQHNKAHALTQQRGTHTILVEPRRCEEGHTSGANGRRADIPLPSLCSSQRLVTVSLAWHDSHKASWTVLLSVAKARSSSTVSSSVTLPILRWTCFSGQIQRLSAWVRAFHMVYIQSASSARTRQMLGRKEGAPGRKEGKPQGDSRREGLPPEDIGHGTAKCQKAYKI